jgi:S-adenosylmethionine:diacylglycerol 3-amino-3-carboxypropyl transferase
VLGYGKRLESGREGGVVKRATLRDVPDLLTEKELEELSDDAARSDH